jgi:response regulator NasT
MFTIRSKIIVSDPCTETRIKICTWLTQEGYSAFESIDAYKTLRLARQLLPTMVLLDLSHSGMGIKQLIHIIETDGLSKVALLSSIDNLDTRNLLAPTALKLLFHKPLEQGQFLMSIRRATEVLNEKRIEILQTERSHLNKEKALTIEAAKKSLMGKWHVTEDQAYTYIRKHSMDHSVSIYATSKAIIKRHSPSF